MNQSNRDIKNKRIAESMAATYQKRQSQICRVYTVKIDSSRLSARQKEQLKMLFVEGKRIKNDCLNWCEQNPDNKPWNYVCGKSVQYKTKTGEFIDYELKYIGSQMKQSVVAEIVSNIRTLSTLKKQGYKVGRLKYISELKSISLKQYLNTYRFCEHNKMKIQNIHGLLKVNGLKQFINIPGIEYANAKLLNRPDGYYIAITTYIPKVSVKSHITRKGVIGIDFGCSTTVTLSNGEKFNVSVQETERLKRLQRKLNRQAKGSKQRYKTRCKIQKEYQHLSNIKNNKANKLATYISSYETVVMQNEQISQWQKNGHGKTVQHSILGRLSARLKNKPNVHVISKWCPTTKLCSCCGATVDMTLSDRTFKCSNCGCTQDRDVHAAQNMIWFDNLLVGAEHTKLTHVEIMTAVSDFFRRKL